MRSLDEHEAYQLMEMRYGEACDPREKLYVRCLSLFFLFATFCYLEASVHVESAAFPRVVSFGGRISYGGLILTM